MSRETLQIIALFLYPALASLTFSAAAIVMLRFFMLQNRTSLAASLYLFCESFTLIALALSAGANPLISQDNILFWVAPSRALMLIFLIWLMAEITLEWHQKRRKP